jgi:hypothetical protein
VRSVRQGLADLSNENLFAKLNSPADWQARWFEEM